MRLDTTEVQTVLTATTINGCWKTPDAYKRVFSHSSSVWWINRATMDSPVLWWALSKGKWVMFKGELAQQIKGRILSLYVQ